MDLKLKAKTTQSHQTVKAASCVCDFITTFMEASAVLQVMHRQNSNPAVHQPLGDLYDAITDHLDSIVEKWQGYTRELVTGYGVLDLKSHEGKNPLIYLEYLCYYLEENRKIFGNYSPIQNEVDNLANDINKTIFLLKFNKPL